MRWAIILNSYDYKIKHIYGKENAPADVLSRLLINGVKSIREESGYPHRSLLNLRTQNLPLTKRSLQDKTSSDILLIKVKKILHNVWPEKKNITEELLTFYEK